MSLDAELRSCRRASLMSGDPADEARVLRDRMRAGELAPWRVETSAMLGDQTARCVVGARLTNDRGEPVGPDINACLVVIAMLVQRGGPCQDGDQEEKAVGVLAAVGMQRVALKAHHERVEALRQRAGLAEAPEPRLAHAGNMRTCSNPTCDLAIRALAAAHRWAWEPDLRPAAMSLCFMLARMQARPTGIAYGADPPQTIELDVGASRTGAPLWTTAGAAMAAHEGGRPDLLERCLGAVRQEVMGAAGLNDRDDVILASIRAEVVPWLLR